MIDRVYNIIDNIEMLDIKNKLDKIKKEIKEDENTRKLIKKFNNVKELYEKYNYKDEFLLVKKELMNNKLIKSYIEIQNEFSLLSLYINKKLDMLLDNKKCKKN